MAGLTREQIQARKDAEAASASTDTDPLAALIAKAESDPDYASKTLAQLQTAPPAGLSEALLLRLTEALEKMQPAPPPRYVAVDGKTEVEPTDLEPGTCYFTADFRIAEKKPKTPAWMIEKTGVAPFVNQTEWLTHVIVDGHRFNLPLEEEVLLPRNVYDHVQDTIQRNRDAASGRQLRRETGNKVSVKAGPLRPMIGFENTTPAQEAQAS